MSIESVLLIDDDAPARAYLERQLAEDGFSVLAAEATGDAFALAETENPDVVLLGATLSFGSGFEVCRALRSGEEGRRWNRDVPLIMLGQTDDPVERVRGLTRGADDFVSRPFA
ncbi:MAG: response regulator transcription factor, partial [Gaiellaceae bacterium]